MKKLFGFFLAIAMLLSLLVPAFAAVEDTGYSDVAADAWYAGAVEYVTEHGLMNGTGDGRFDPGADTSRAMLVTILWRLAGEPQVNYLMQFPDVGEDWYTEAVRWAASEQIVGGYDNGLFGTSDPVSREQIVTILWRYQGSPAAESGQDFADEDSISSYAVQAVDWAQANSIVSGKPGNRFDPKGHATRAETATILQNFLALETAPTPEPTPEPVPEDPESKTLVVYFSATNTTERVAQTIASTLGADIFELTPAQPYSSADLNYSNPDSRVCREHNDPSLQNITLSANTVDNWDEYDTIFVGYPIWWHAAAWPVNNFITGNDFTGKTVVPFCTSASSGLEGSDVKLRGMAGTGNWLPGRNFFSRDSEAVIADWLNSLGLN